MRLYLDDDCIARQLVQALRRAGHEIQIPHDMGLRGAHDAVHFLHAVRENRLLLTSNHRDFLFLHNLIRGSGGGHAGLLVIRKDDDSRRDMKVADTVRAIAHVESSGFVTTSEIIILNHWR